MSTSAEFVYSGECFERYFANPQATYACINYGEAHAPAQIKDRSILINVDSDAVFSELLEIYVSRDGFQVL